MNLVKYFAGTPTFGPLISFDLILIFFRDAFYVNNQSGWT